MSSETSPSTLCRLRFRLAAEFVMIDLEPCRVGNVSRPARRWAEDTREVPMNGGDFSAIMDRQMVG